MLSTVLSVMNNDDDIYNSRHLLVHGIMGNGHFYITGCLS